MATRLTERRESAESQFNTDRFQRGLAHWNRERLRPGFPTGDWPLELERDLRMRRLEGAFTGRCSMRGSKRSRSIR